PGDVVAVEDHAALVGAIVAGDHVEERGLAGAVGPDDAEQVAGPHLHAHLAHGGEAAEALGDALEAQQGRRAHAWARARRARRRPATPDGPPTVRRARLSAALAVTAITLSRRAGMPSACAASSSSRTPARR